MKIKKDDMVMVLTGKDKGKTGKVRRVFPKLSRVIVDGVALVKKHQKPTPAGNGGIVEKEMPIHVSNVMLVGADSRPSRVGYRIEDGKKVRFFKKTGDSVA